MLVGATVAWRDVGAWAAGLGTPMGAQAQARRLLGVQTLRGDDRCRRAPRAGSPGLPPASGLSDRRPRRVRGASAGTHPAWTESPIRCAGRTAPTASAPGTP